MSEPVSLWRRLAHAAGKPLRRARYRKLKAGLDQAESAEHVFTEIYEHNLWGEAESRSGAGSTLAYTANIRAALPGVMVRHGLTTILDAPCGDFHWMQTVQFAADVRYVGGDIVAAMAADLARKHAGPGRQFLQLDITKGPFPDHDLWFSRDCWFHLSYRDTARAIRAFLASTGRYALVSTHIKDGEKPSVNKDISTGDARAIDLLSAPYGFCEPLERIDDWVAPFHPRIMGLWSKDQIAAGAASLLAAYPD
jgi:hypothetical protein